LTPEVSVIIPVYNEAEIINESISLLIQSAGNHNIEIIVVDGHPDQTTLPVIQHHVLKISSRKGRAIQMNRGAEVATGGIMLFLHADTRLPANGMDLIIDRMSDEKIAGGAFDLAIDAPGWGYRLVEWMASKRSRITRIPYGDQAIFIRRNRFERIGGYPEIALMEDVALTRALKKQGESIGFISHPVKTSARRWQKRGLFLGTLRNWVLIILYLMGVSPEKLAKHY